MNTRHDYDPKALMVSHRKRSGMVRGGRGGLTPRVRRALEAIIAGEATTYEAACELAGLTTRALRAALKKPDVLGFYKRELEALKDAERVRSLRRLIEIRDDAGLRATAAGSKTVIEATKALHEEPGSRGGPNVHISIGADGQGFQQRVPGYLIVSRFGRAEIEAKLAASGSSASIFDDPNMVIEDAEFTDITPDPIRGQHRMPEGG